MRLTNERYFHILRVAFLVVCECIRSVSCRLRVVGAKYQTCCWVQRKESQGTNNHKTILVVKHVVFWIGIEVKHLFYIVKLQNFVHLCDGLQLFLYFYKLNLIIQEMVYRNYNLWRKYWEIRKLYDERRYLLYCI